MNPPLWQHSEWIAHALALATIIGVVSAFTWSQTRERAQHLLGRRTAFGRAALVADAPLLLAMTLIGVALLGPRLAERDVAVSTRGMDVVLLLDTSQSMEARDTPPSRAARAHAAARALLERLDPDDRAALAVFAGRGALLTPLTPDRDALQRLLPDLDARSIRPGGTDLDAGLRAALGAFEPADERARAIVLISDGERTGASGDAGLRGAALDGVRVHTLALGHREGAEVPDAGAPLRDRAGRIVTSRRRDAPLERLAEATGGASFVADEWGVFDLEGVEQALRAALPSDPGAGASALQRRRVPSIAPFVAAAALLLCLPAIPRPRLRRLANGGAARAALPAVCLLLVGAHAGDAREAADARASRAIERGLEAATRSAWAEAAAHFERAAEPDADVGLRALALYDLGVVAIERGALEAARDAFYAALALAPDDAQARLNVEWTLHRLDADPPSAGEAGESPRTLGAGGDAAVANPPRGAPTAPSATDERTDTVQPPRAREDSSGRKAPRPSPTASASPATPAAPESLSKEELRRWLDRVDDEAGLTLRLLGRGDAGAARAEAPSW